MNPFNRRAASRIAAASLALAALASPAAWFLARETAEEAIVSLAVEESGRLLRSADAIDLGGPQAADHARQAATAIIGGLFDIAEIYDRKGAKLAEATTSQGHELEHALPPHGAPTYTASSYESLKLDDGRWVLRTFVPLRAQGSGRMEGALTGYFEGVRLVPSWQRQQVMQASLNAALLAALSSLGCGLVLYPVVVRLSKDNERKAREVLDAHLSMMEALGSAIAKRDSDTGAHNYRVAWIAARIAEAMGLRGPPMQALIAGSFLHDIGKIGVPDAILLKPGRLDDAEIAVMRTHVAQGEEIVEGIGWLVGARDVVSGHHEKWDGSGYPRGLAGQAIPLAARIFAVADVFDALCSKRPYKSAMPFEAAMAILTRDTGSHFDPTVIAAFQPMAAAVHARLSAIDENDARHLLQERVSEHFHLAPPPEPAPGALATA